MSTKKKAAKNKVRVISDGTSANTKIVDENGDLIKAFSIQIKTNAHEPFVEATIHIAPEFDIEIDKDNVTYQILAHTVDKLQLEKDDIIVLKNNGTPVPFGIIERFRKYLLGNEIENKLLYLPHNIELGLIKIEAAVGRG